MCRDLAITGHPSLWTSIGWGAISVPKLYSLYFYYQDLRLGQGMWIEFDNLETIYDFTVPHFRLYESSGAGSQEGHSKHVKSS